MLTKKVAHSRAFIVSQLLILAYLAVAPANGQTEPGKDRPAYKVAPAAPGADVAPVSSISQRYEYQGMLIEFSINAIKGDSGKDAGLVAGADATVSFRVTDKSTGQPIRGLRPNAWISGRVAEHAPNEAECKDSIRAFMAGRLSTRADMDLNGYSMLTLNHDNTITFINPQIAFNVTKLESIIPLPGLGLDWVLSKNKDFLYVTIPSQSSVAVINTITRKLIGTVSTGDKTRPARLAMQPDGRYIWIGLDNSPSVAVIDAATNKLAGVAPAGAGLHNIAFTPDSRFAYVTNSAADTVSAIDTTTRLKITDIPVGKTPVPIAFSTAGNAVYVAAINGGSLEVISPEKQQVVKKIPLARGVVALRFDRSGRYGFAINQIEGLASVIDAATNGVIAEGEVAKGADQVTFTNSYAYVRGTETEKFSLIELNEVKRGKFAPVNIQAGSLAPSASPQDIGVADMIQPTPDGTSVIIANAPDQMSYYYVEGMMVPMGTFQNYKRKPRGLMLIDRSLTESGPGVYSSTVKLKSAGLFDVPVIFDQPRITNCFEARVGDSPLAERIKAQASTLIEALFKGNRYDPAAAVTLKFKVSDSITQQPISGLKDVQILIFEPPGIWQKRVWAKEVSTGIYQVTELFPHEGYFRVMTQIASRGIRYASLPFTNLEVVSDSKVDNASVKKSGDQK
ncbi:MAG TPA: YncE family protein [Blastocatellia bacterium]|jgi:YVTN family beta-propeller protein|nr:YncE family protein [Blastocatellia bacterium]